MTHVHITSALCTGEATIEVFDLFVNIVKCKSPWVCKVGSPRHWTAVNQDLKAAVGYGQCVNIGCEIINQSVIIYLLVITKSIKSISLKILLYSNDLTILALQSCRRKTMPDYKAYKAALGKFNADLNPGGSFY